MTVSDGRFALLPADAVEVDTSLMTDDLTFERADGPALHLEGKKYLRQTPGSSPLTTSRPSMSRSLAKTATTSREAS